MNQDYYQYIYNLHQSQRIRPAEFQVNVQVRQAHEGALEAKAEGC
jgi:hypothetical protein